MANDTLQQWADIIERMADKEKRMSKFTKPQLLALKEIHQKREKKRTYLQLRRECFLAYDDCLMVPLTHILLGIEADGHVHS